MKNGAQVTIRALSTRKAGEVTSLYSNANSLAVYYTIHCIIVSLKLRLYYTTVIDRERLLMQ